MNLIALQNIACIKEASQRLPFSTFHEHSAMQGQFSIQANFKYFSPPKPHFPRYHQNKSFIDTKIFSVNFETLQSF